MIRDTPQQSRLSLIYEDELDSPRQQNINNKNSDIEYMLTFVNFKQAQQLNISQNNNNEGNKQQKQQHKHQRQYNNNIPLKHQKSTLDQESITKYIKQNSSKQSDNPNDRNNLISFIDAGLGIMSAVKNLMTIKKKQSIKKGSTTLQKPSAYDLIKGLFFSKNKQYSQQQKQIKMQQLKTQQQLIMLLHRVQIGGNDINTNNKYKYLLTVSWYQQLQQIEQSTTIQKDKHEQIVNLINELQLTLDKLQNIVGSKNKDANNNIKRQKLLISKQTTLMIETAWNFVDQLTNLIHTK